MAERKKKGAKIIQALDAAEAAPPPPLPPRNEDLDPIAADCPITPLGHRSRAYYFLSPAGELLELKAREFTEIGLISLFDGDRTWLFKQFKRTNSDGDVTGFKVKVSGAWLMQACAKQGLFDPATPVRGPGVWRDGDNQVLVHSGDAILTNGEWVKPGLRRNGYIYAALPKLERPAATPADAELGKALLAALRRWNYELDIGPEIVCGFIGAAMLGGAPRWRAHLYVLAEYGSGKSFLAELVAAALGAAAHPATNSYTEAGLRQALTGEARAIILDEAEHDEGRGRVAKVIELIRFMSSGEGARALRGTTGGQAQGFQVTGCAYLSSVLRGKLKPQDRSRITMIELGPLPHGTETVDAVDQVLTDQAAMRVASPALRARAIAGWPRFLASFEAYRSGLLAAGSRPREADQLATLAAGRDLLIHDDVPEPAVVETEVSRFDELIDNCREDEEQNEGLLCLTHLYSQTPDLWRGSDRCTIARLILAAMDETVGDTRTVLGNFGLKLVHWREAKRRALLVANNHGGLDRLFADTRWSDGAWKRALRYLPGARAAEGHARFAGVQSRATLVPAEHLPKQDEDE